jgi:ClpP class serine protease
LIAWLITPDVAHELSRAQRTVVVSPEQLAVFMRAHGDVAAGEMPRNMSIAGDVAQINVHGVLTKSPDWYAKYFGGGNTTYRSIIDGLAQCQVNDTVRRVEINVDSPGGLVDGLFDAIAALNAFRKPISVVASCACSAAYAIAASAGPIRAVGRAANFGSIGTAVSFSFYESETIVTLTNTDSPDKRPDVTTDAGKKVVVEYLDAVNELFVEAIAYGRKVKPTEVSKKYGRGAVLLADSALELRMIDSITEPGLGYARSDTEDSDEEATMNLATLKTNHPEVYAAAVKEGQTPPAPAAPPAVTPVASAAPGGAQQKETNMDLKTLKAQHPEAYEAAVAVGVTQERDRVGAHLELGESCGAMELAVASVKAGTEMTQTLSAKYLAAGVKQNAVAARQSETDTAAAALNGAKPGEAKKTLLDAAADAICGVEA